MVKKAVCRFYIKWKIAIKYLIYKGKMNVEKRVENVNNFL